MLPIPQKNGYRAKLKADFEVHKCWFELEKIPQTENEKRQEEILQLKQNLLDTDYQAIKYAEGYFSEEEYTPIKEQRQAWRDRINELEANLAEKEPQPELEVSE